MKPTVPLRIKDAVSKVVAELATFLDVEIALDAKGIDCSTLNPVAVPKDQLYACETERTVDQTPVAFLMSPKAICQIGKTLLLLPSAGPDDAEVNPEILEAFGEVFNVIVGTWNRVVDERARLKAAVPSEGIHAYNKAELSEKMAAEEIDVWIFPLTIGGKKHALGLLGSAEWLGTRSAEANKKKPAKPPRPTKAAAAEPTSPEQPAAASAEDDAGDSADSAAGGGADEDAYEVVQPQQDDESDECEIVTPEEELDPRDSAVAQTNAPTRQAAGAQSTGAAARPAQPSGVHSSLNLGHEPVAIVDETGALAHWLATQLQMGRLACLRTQDGPGKAPSGASVVVVHPEKAGLDRLKVARTYVLRQPGAAGG
jgi:hypothetical protein